MAEFQQYVWVDVDSTLAHYDGWKGIDHIGEPFPHAADFMTQLTILGEKSGFKVGVFTTRCKADMPGREDVARYFGDTDEDIAAALADKVEAWLKKHGILFDTVYVGQGKPPGIAYIDDRAVWCCPKTFGAKAAYDAALEGVVNLMR
ncbi:MAG TPA: hypothetical protein VMZ71_02250 [Gemmataceae bacterium]|nr:hypothetical protein [Gemmataceae bacterium]